MQTRRPTMPLSDLEAAGEALYGPAWQSALARDLDVNLRTMQRWAAGEAEPPDLRHELAALCRMRGNALAALADRLDPR